MPHPIPATPGDQYGQWTIITEAINNKHGQRQVLVRCTCGTVDTRHFGNVRRGLSWRCGGCVNESRSEAMTGNGACAPTSGPRVKKTPTVGEQFGSWTVLEEMPSLGASRSIRVDARCGGCEKVWTVRYAHLRYGASTQCQDCARGKIPAKPGDRYGAWTILGEVKPGSRRQRRVEARCDCGTEHVVLFANMTKGASRRCFSCGIGQRQQV